MAQAILVLGATGKQGSATLRAILAHSDFSPNRHTILAVTRNPSSSSAKALAALSPAVTLVVGDLRKPEALFSKLRVVPSAVFLMTNIGKNEAKDGIGAVNGAIKAGASRIVFASIDRGASSGPTDVPHFATKYLVEEHLRRAAAESLGRVAYTIIRSPFFLDSLEPGVSGKVVATTWRDHCPRLMAVVDTRDVGSYAAAALLEPEGYSGAYRNAEYNIAGDRLTFADANRIFEQKSGKPLPTAASFWPRLFLHLSRDYRKTVEFYQKEGFFATPEATTLHHMADFSEWIERSKHAEQQNQRRNSFANQR